jgi:uncharacterized lipoprotein YddW (UPF0748 family)
MRQGISKAAFILAAFAGLSLSGACAEQLPSLPSLPKPPAVPTVPSVPKPTVPSVPKAPDPADEARRAAEKAIEDARKKAENAIPTVPGATRPEVRGVWVTTTANDAIANAKNTGETMKRLREIGINTVYVETWKNGYTQFPSAVLKKVIGVDRRPALMKSDPSDTPETIRTEGRDLLEETLIEAHRNGLIYVAWFEYGFMAAHKDTDNHLRRMYPQWLSRDIKGNEVAPNGFVWMNPLHPEPRKFLIDLVVEAAKNYDLDGVQLDDRIVWPYINMGYDDFTKAAYAKENAGKEPPADHKDAMWMRWRADKVNEYAKMFTQTVRSEVPGVQISLSPAVYPWCFDNYLLEWPKWASWTKADALKLGDFEKATQTTPHWDEYIPQNYRYNYPAFEATWKDQVKHMNELGGGKVNDLLAGIMSTGSEPKPVAWDDLRKAVEYTRASGAGGHVWWFSKGTLDVYPEQTKALYNGWIESPRFPAGWREPSVKFTRDETETYTKDGNLRWLTSTMKPGRYRTIIHDGTRWSYHAGSIDVGEAAIKTGMSVIVPPTAKQVEMIRDRRADRRSK